MSTWFANARRRLKKENKLQWSNTPGELDRKPRDDDDDDDVDDDVSCSDCNDVIADYEMTSVDECRVGRRQVALTVAQQVKDAANRLGI